MTGPSGTSPYKGRMGAKPRAAEGPFRERLLYSA